MDARVCPTFPADPHWKVGDRIDDGDKWVVGQIAIVLTQFARHAGEKNKYRVEFYDNDGVLRGDMLLEGGFLSRREKR